MSVPIKFQQTDDIPVIRAVMLTLQSYMSGVVGAFSLIINNLMRANNVVTNILGMPIILGLCILERGGPWCLSFTVFPI